MTNFVLTKDLSALTEEERAQHLVNVCEAAGLDSRAGLLKYTMMDDNTGTGQRRLVLYATKGATNAIREIKGIDVIEMTDKVIDGTIVFTAKAKNAKGRTDIAVGAAVIKSKAGKQLENAFALAQTRATRRVTLQMSGLDLLDESEVFNDGTTSLADAALPLAEIGQPVEISNEAGKDITGGLSILAPAKVEFHVQLPPHAGTTAVGIPPVPLVQAPPIEEARIPNPAAGMKVSPTNIMAGPDGPELLVAQTQVIAEVETPKGPTDEQVKTRKKRRTKAEMEASKATVVETPATASLTSPQEAAKVVAATTLVSAPEVVSTVVEIPVVVETPVRRSVIGTSTTLEQRTAYVAKLTNYRDVLIEGGLVPSEGLGPNRKIREFVKIANNGLDLNDLSVEQWENTFRYFDVAIRDFGVKKLIETIEFNIKKSAEVIA